MPQPELFITKDGSHSLHLPHLNEQYHSIHGAIQESQHIYIQNGLLQIQKSPPIAILEIGFGTGLNALLTQETNIPITYTTLEPHPISLWPNLNYPEKLHIPNETFHHLHTCPWETPTQLTPTFTLTKHQTTLQKFIPPHTYDLIYFDAFNPSVAPELWTLANFQKLYKTLNTNGIFITYSAKGTVRRTLTEVGFTVKKLAGPPGKKHITQALKNYSPKKTDPTEKRIIENFK